MITRIRQLSTFPSPRPSHRKPRSKDLRYDGKSSQKAFLHKFVRLARSEQWTEVEQHDQFCFALKGMASEYYTVLLETDPGVCLGAILKKFDKRFGSWTAPDLTHQLTSSRRCRTVGSPCTSGLTGYSSRLPGPSLSSLTSIPWLCYMGEDRDAGMYALDGQPKTEDEAVDRMQFSSIRDRGDRRSQSLMWWGSLPHRRRPHGREMVALPGKFRISRGASRNCREPCRNGHLCNLMQPNPPRRTSPMGLETLEGGTAICRMGTFSPSERYRWTAVRVIILRGSLFFFTTAGSAVLLCPVHLDVCLWDFLVVPAVHLLTDTLFTPHTFHVGADSTAVSSTPLTRMHCLRLKELSGPCCTCAVSVSDCLYPGWGGPTPGTHTSPIFVPRRNLLNSRDPSWLSCKWYSRMCLHAVSLILGISWRWCTGDPPPPFKEKMRRRGGGGSL